MKNILCYGDSLTAGYNDDGKNFYPYSLFLKDLLINKYNVDYIGVSGAIVDEILKNIEGEITDITGIGWNGLRKQLENKNYEYCILLIGSNDLSDYNPKSVTDDILKLHSIIHEMGVKSIALTIPKLKFEKIDTDMKDVREKINKNLLEYNGKNKMFNIIDLAEKIDNLDEQIIYDYDGLHFSKNGYYELAKIVYEFFDN